MTATTTASGLNPAIMMMNRMDAPTIESESGAPKDAFLPLMPANAASTRPVTAASRPSIDAIPDAVWRTPALGYSVTADRDSTSWLAVNQAKPATNTNGPTLPAPHENLLT